MKNDSRRSETSLAKVRWNFSILGISDSKKSAFSAGYPGSIPGSEGSPGEGNSNPLQ